ncbi:hypothetical protein ACLIBG_10850 [Virgibacillus sp. W0181]|uniref:hypothetical protein n=1 Tax=Virgibacillus sp. W0181 TaxID=3391581 RepID=UPI003F487AD9
MLIFSIIAYSTLLVAIVSTILALTGKHSWYWIAAIGIYIFSFLAGFSIGQLTVGLTFVPLTLAIAHSFGWIKTNIHGIIFLGLGFLFGLLMVIYVDNAWLFFGSLSNSVGG